MDLQNFMDAEYCIDKYFEKHLKERLDFYIDSRNAALVAGRSTGFGITNALAPSEDYATNVTLNFPAKDIEKLGAELQRDKGMSHDIEVLTQAWRKAAVAQVGEARYQELSQKLGGDFATAYVGHRLMMTRHTVLRCYRWAMLRHQSCSSISTSVSLSVMTRRCWSEAQGRCLVL